MLSEKSIDLRNPPESKSVDRTPLLWVLIPLIAGYSFCHLHALSCPLQPLWIGATTALCAVSYWTSKQAIRIWAISFLLSVFCLSILWAWDKIPSCPLRTQLSPQKGRVTLRVERLFNSKKSDKTSGIAIAQHLKKPLKALEGKPIYFNLKSPDQPLMPGQTIVAYGWLRPTGAPRTTETDRRAHADADAFDTFLIKSGINLKFTQGSVRHYITMPSRYQIWLTQFNHRCTQKLMLGANTTTLQYAKTYAAMLLGNKGLLTDEQKQNLNITGTMHLFAVSGIHVGVVALTLNLLFGILRMPTCIAQALSLAGAYGYVQITGYAPSAQRAFLMVAFLYLGQSLRRQTSVWRAWVACALLVLVLRPAALFTPGFLLSYSAVAGLILYGGPLAHRILTHYHLYTQPFESYFTWSQKLKFRSLRFAIRGACACLGASVLCIPLSAYYFSTFSLMGLFFNLIIMSWISIVIVQGTLSLCLAWAPGAASFINKGAFLTLMLTEKCLIKNIPSTGLTWWQVGPHFGQWVTVYSCINLAFMLGLHLRGPAPAWLYWVIAVNFVLCCLLSPY